MQVTSTNSTTAASGSTSSTSSEADNTIGYNEFLQLLIAQLKSQDPMNPSDPTQFVSQLATLSGVEQSVKQTDLLSKLQTVDALSQAQSLVGANLTSADGSVSGLVTSVQMNDDGTIATLDSGQQVSVGVGVSISR